MLLNYKFEINFYFNGVFFSYYKKSLKFEFLFLIYAVKKVPFSVSHSMIYA